MIVKQFFTYLGYLFIVNEYFNSETNPLLSNTAKLFIIDNPM
jgi:hypothetical protein